MVYVKTCNMINQKDMFALIAKSFRLNMMSFLKIFVRQPGAVNYLVEHLSIASK